MSPAREKESVRLFPLPSVVVFPRTVVPFHFFEPRYRALVRDCLEHGPKEMAVVLLKDGWQSNYEGQPEIHSIAGLGRFVEHRANADGTYDVLLAIEERIELVEEPSEALYRTAGYRVVPDEESTGVDESNDAEVLRALALRLVTAENEFRGRVDTQPFDFTLSCRDLTHVLADRYLRRDAVLRQKILETSNVLERTRLVSQAISGVLAALAPTRPNSLH